MEIYPLVLISIRHFFFKELKIYQDTIIIYDEPVLK